MENRQYEVPAIVHKERPWQWEDIRRELLEKIPSHTEGLDLERIDNFLRSKGLDLKAKIFYQKKDIPEIKKLAKGFAGKRDFDNDGFYNKELDIAFIRRSSKMEKLNGTIFTEKVAIHEEVHASAGFEMYVDVNGQKRSPRIGNLLRLTGKDRACIFRGGFIEEGLSEMLANEYYVAYMEPRHRQEMLDYGSGSLSLNVICDRGETDYPLPLKHSVFVKSKNEKFLDGSFNDIQAFGIELLCKKSPGFDQTLLLARTKIEYLRMIPKMINNLSDGLYPRLAQTTYDQDGAEKGLRMIINELYGGNLPLNEKGELI